MFWLSKGIQFALISGIILRLFSCTCEYAAGESLKQTTAFIDVSVVTMTGDHIFPHQTVLIRDGRIAQIGRVNAVHFPKQTQIINGRGKYLVPGLADMHTHIDNQNDFPLFLSNGVTTTLNMGGARRAYRQELRAGVRAGRIPGPDPLIALLVDGPGDPGGSGAVPRSPDEARHVIDQAKTDGYDYIKIYSRLQPDIFDAIMDEAQTIGMPVIGHVVRSVGLEIGLARGQIMLAHAEEYLTAFGDDPPQSSRIPELVRLSRDRHIYVTANLIGIIKIAEQWGKSELVIEGYLAKPEARFMRPSLRAKWRAKGYTRLKGSYAAEAQFAVELVQALHQSGVPILVGTDTPDIPGVTPGYSVHDEIELLARIGFGNYHALAAATCVPGKFVAATLKHAERFGEVAIGYRADLLLVDCNPLKDLTVLRHPQGVMIRGVWMPAFKLKSMLSKSVPAN